MASSFYLTNQKNSKINQKKTLESRKKQIINIINNINNMYDDPANYNITLANIISHLESGLTGTSKVSSITQALNDSNEKGSINDSKIGNCKSYLDSEKNRCENEISNLNSEINTLDSKIKTAKKAEEEEKKKAIEAALGGGGGSW